MSIGPSARKWLLARYGKPDDKIYTSRFYTADISYSKTQVWFIQIPIEYIEDEQYDFVNIVCQKQVDTDDYYYLKVPTSFFANHKDKFDRIKNKLALYLSANPKSLFVEERGKGRVDFSQFIVN